MVSRRTVLLGAAGVVAAVAVGKPSDKGGAYSPYFSKLNNTLRNHGIGSPVLVIDLDILDRNIDLVAKSVAVKPAKDYRMVTKSIPSPQLVEYVSKRANTQLQMVFHIPFLQAMAISQPNSDILMGKPMPVAAASQFYTSHTSPFNPAKQLQWLIDTPQRLKQYLTLAQSKNVKMRINLELDVGLHRGGFEADAILSEALNIIAQHPQHLEFAGFMGYDAHIMGIPSFLAKRELPKVKQRYKACITLLNKDFPNLVNDRLCFNGAGSPTFRHYEGDDVVTEIAAGSCLMKPTHYDIGILEDFEAAAFIASPVLKRLQGARLPALGWSASLIRGWDKNQTQMYFCYSGNWLARNESPPGLQPHFAYVSSNQQGYSASNLVTIDIDDFIFLRPTQSEAVLLQFGDLVLVRGDNVVDRWPVISSNPA
jgi:D-serine deaminase-like pyridoxal phosphate-dependent protein